jgi:hypothetical protein
MATKRKANPLAAKAMKLVRDQGLTLKQAWAKVKAASSADWDAARPKGKPRKKAAAKPRKKAAAKPRKKAAAKPPKRRKTGGGLLPSMF